MTATPQENNTTPQTVKKSPWKWIAIGCLGIVVLTIGGCALMVKYGYATVTVNGKPLGVEEANLESGPPSVAESWVGLWRNGEDVSKGFFRLKSDGTVNALTITEDGTQNEHTGKYTLSGGKLVITDVIYNGAPLEKGTALTFTFETSGDTALLNGVLFKRVPAEDVDAVLANPTAP